LFRQYVYISTSSFLNWVSVNASAIREAGPFTNQDLNSRMPPPAWNSPWTALGAHFTADRLLHPGSGFPSLIEEYFNTSSYVGLQHKFGDRWTVALLAEDLRSWRVQGVQYATAQAFLPGARFEFRAKQRWNVQGSFLLSRGSGYHEYDNAQSEFLVSYSRPMHGMLRDDQGTTPLPIHCESPSEFNSKPFMTSRERLEARFCR